MRGILKMEKNYMKFGIISDIQDGKNLDRAIEVLEKNRGVYGYILLGDLGKDDKSLYTNLSKVLETGKIVGALPGEQEGYEDWKATTEYLQSIPGYKLLDGVRQNFRIKKGNMIVDFLTAPGTDNMQRPDAHIFTADPETKSGTYTPKNGEKSKFIFNLNDVESDAKTADNPNTILLSHNPPKFNGEQALDYTSRNIVSEDFELNLEKGPVTVRKGTVIERDELELIKSAGIPYSTVLQNVGNDYLAEMCREGNITKGIHAHVKNAAGRANDLDSKVIDASIPQENIFVNASCLEEGEIGIVKIYDDNKMSYEYIDLENIPVKGARLW